MIHVKHLKRKKLFALTDIFCVYASMFVAVYIRAKINLPIFRDLIPNPYLFPSLWFLFAFCILGWIFAIISYLIGVYDLWHNTSTIIWIEKLIIPNIMITSLSFSYLYIWQDFNFPRSYLGVFFVVNFILSIVWRVIYFNFYKKEISKVVLIGDKFSCIKFSEEFEKEPFLARVKVCAIFTPNQSNEHPRNIPLQHISKFEEYSHNFPYTSVIIVSSSSSSQENIFTEIFKVARRGVPVYTVPTAYEILLGRLKHIHVNDLPLLELKLDQSVSLYIRAKRSCDVIFSLLLIGLLLPFMLITALLVKLTSKGPILFFQERVGKNKETFKIIKFRSMILDAEKNTGAIFALKNDPRVTKIGRFMRKTRLDELPQLFNILFGEMSFIGPRPERPCFVDKYENEIPAYSERVRIRPGVTGLAQVHGDYNSSPETKLKYDLAYLVHQNIFLDVQILLKTLKTIFMKSGQ